MVSNPSDVSYLFKSFIQTSSNGLESLSEIGSGNPNGLLKCVINGVYVFKEKQVKMNEGNRHFHE